MQTINVPQTPTLLLAASTSPRWVSISSENASLRVQYDGLPGTDLTTNSGELVTPQNKFTLEGARAMNAIWGIAADFNARVTVQSAITGADSVPSSEGVNTAILNALKVIANPMSTDPTSGRVRVMLDSNGGAQTLGTVTTVASLTNMAQVGGFAANSFIVDTTYMQWADAVRGRIS